MKTRSMIDYGKGKQTPLFMPQKKIFVYNVTPEYLYYMIIRKLSSVYLDGSAAVIIDTVLCSPQVSFQYTLRFYMCISHP